MATSTKSVSRHVELLRDKWQHPVQALSPEIGTSVVVTIGATSQSGALPASSEIIRCAANGNCHLIFGVGSAPTATTSEMLFPAGSEIFVVPTGATHFAVIQANASTGTFSITKVS